jgi:CRISPR system Cascade subunit CasB
MSALLDYLVRKKDDRGVMAELRCALVDSKRHRAYPYLGWCGGIGQGHSARVKQTVAGLYASHPEMTSNGNTGSLCREMCRPDEDLEKGPMAKRLQYLLAAGRDEILDRVIRIVLRAKAEGIQVNYTALEDDLNYWGDEVKNKWAATFWTPSAEADHAIPD